jgi:hypothetical protein
VGVTTAACSGGGGGGVVVATTTYVAQVQAGSGDGSSCANARPVSFFNTAANWGVGKPIAPGVTVGLCGTISTKLTVQGSGAAGSPITIQWQPGARLSLAVCGCVNMDGRSWIVLDGGSNGILEGTANGTNLANHQSATGISADSCSNCEIENLVVQNIYVIAPGDSFICSSGCVVDNAGAKCVRFSGANWKIHDNVFHDASWCLYEYGNGTDSNTRIYNNEIYNFDHGWIVTGGGPWGNLYFYGNHIHDMGPWDACDVAGNNCHHDGIHCFFGPGAGAHFPGSYIYNNRWDGTLGGNTTSWIYLEANSSSPCADSTSKWYLFNNVFSSSDVVSTNPYLGSSGSVNAPTYLYNNTFDGPGAGHYGNNQSACVYASKTFENNAVGGCSRLVELDASLVDFNAYAETSGGNCWANVGCNFPAWQATGRDPHSVYNAAAATGTNTSSVATNLTSLCQSDPNLAPLCADINGNPRPTTGNWNAGAFN